MSLTLGYYKFLHLTADLTNDNSTVTGKIKIQNLSYFNFAILCDY